MVLLLLTGINWLDPVVAILVALFIIRESYHLLKRAFTPLLDTAWSDDEIKELEEDIKESGCKLS